MAVLLPILGTSWVFGVLAVNKESVAFQYLFAILNSLQVGAWGPLGGPVGCTGDTCLGITCPRTFAKLQLGPL